MIAKRVHGHIVKITVEVADSNGKTDRVSGQFIVEKHSYNTKQTANDIMKEIEFRFQQKEAEPAIDAF